MLYGKVTREQIETLFEELARPRKEEFVLYTGAEGKFMFDLALAYPDGRVHLGITGYVKRTNYRRLRGTYLISLFEKHGTWKVRLKRGKEFCFTLYDGTKEVCQTDSTDSLNDAINKYIINK